MPSILDHKKYYGVKRLSNTLWMAYVDDNRFCEYKYKIIGFYDNAEDAASAYDDYIYENNYNCLILNFPDEYGYFNGSDEEKERLQKRSLDNPNPPERSR